MQPNANFLEQVQGVHCCAFAMYIKMKSVIGWLWVTTGQAAVWLECAWGLLSCGLWAVALLGGWPSQQAAPFTNSLQLSSRRMPRLLPQSLAGTERVLVILQLKFRPALASHLASSVCCLAHCAAHCTAARGTASALAFSAPRGVAPALPLPASPMLCRMPCEETLHAPEKSLCVIAGGGCLHGQGRSAGGGLQVGAALRDGVPVDDTGRVCGAGE